MIKLCENELQYAVCSEFSKKKRTKERKKMVIDAMP